MKVFEVITEFAVKDEHEITRETQYVTSEEDSILTVTEYFARHCFEYEKELISVREVITIVQHIEGKK